MPGKGKMQITGKLGDVMQESVKKQNLLLDLKVFNMALFLLYLRKGIFTYMFLRERHQKMDLCRKAMVTSIVSAITNNPVNREIAMTGEVTLIGQVLPIGGLKENC